MADHDLMLMPTVPVIAPKIAELEASDEAYFAANGLMLRNPTLINFLDGCAVSLPCHRPGEAPVGLSLAGTAAQDQRLLSVALAVEALLAKPDCRVKIGAANALLQTISDRKHSEIYMQQAVAAPFYSV